jgi:Uma2 family endonuclease
MTSDKKKHDQIREGLVTYEIYADMPDDGQRYEVDDGQLELMSPAPAPRHQSVINEIVFKLNQSCRSDYIIYTSPIDVILSDIEVRQPDIVMVHHTRMSIITQRGIEGPPDLVMEVVSPHSRKRDKVKKTKAYARYGVAEYWIIDPANRTIEQYVINEDKYELAEVYNDDEPIHSERVTCAAFTLAEILAEVPNTPE